MTFRLGLAFSVVFLAAAACSSNSPTERAGDTGIIGGSGGSGLGPSPSGNAGTSLINPSPTPTGDGGGQSDCDTTLKVTFRDFSEKHPDFEMAFAGDVVRRQLLESALGADHKPVFQSSTGCPFKKGTPLDCDNWTTTTPVINSAATFGQWYRTTDGVNIEFAKTIDLTETPTGSGQYQFASTAFFPLSPTEGFGITPANNHLMQNFLFTTEIHLRFGYIAGQKFTFSGDDDLWIFVNGKLALDLGSMHAAEEGTIDFDAQKDALAIAPGNTYAMDIFHAERHTDASNFKVTTNISCFTPVDIVN